MEIFKYFSIIFIVMLIVFVVFFGFVVLMIFSPKMRAKMMSKNIKATKYVIDDQKENLEDIVTTSANIGKNGITITTKAIKDGLTDNTIYCKYCGEIVDSDSVFCKKCGKKQ